MNLQNNIKIIIQTSLIHHKKSRVHQQGKKNEYLIFSPKKKPLKRELHQRISHDLQKLDYLCLQNY